MTAPQDFRRIWSRHVPGLISAPARYAVLCPLVEQPDGLHILLEVRAATVKQAGEVCFPGGRMENGETFEACALRETFEELAIPPDRVELIGRTDFVCQPGKFLLQPVIGLVSPEGLAAMTPSPAEVAEAFSVPLAFLQNTPPEIYINELKATLPPDFPYETSGIPRDYRWSNAVAEVPIWHYEGHVIWGMTARILLDMIRRLAERPHLP